MHVSFRLCLSVYLCSCVHICLFVYTESVSIQQLPPAFDVPVGVPMNVNEISMKEMNEASISF